MSSQLTDLQNMAAPYTIPIVVVGGIVLALWLVLVLRALQAHNESDAAQLDRFLKDRSR